MLVIAMFSVAIIAAIVAAYYEGLIPKYRTAFQSADWHEALHGAEAGVDFAVQTLNTSALSSPTPDSYTWTGWTVDSTYSLNGLRTYNSTIDLGGNERVKVTSLTVDVYTRDTSSSTSPSYDPWFRVRSTARADLPGKYVTQDKRDAKLRHMALNSKNGSADDPHVSRTVEVILKPRYRFDNAIVSMKSLSLGNSANWGVDSFDSTDPNHSDSKNGTSAGGYYSSSNANSNGTVGTLNTEPTGVTYGPLISGNGATVAGDVKTQGGDDPSTTTHENVSGSGGMTQSRIYDNFDEDFPSPVAPTWTSYLSAPSGNTGFATGSKTSPDRYVLSGNLGAFAVAAPSSGTGYVEIWVKGDLSVGNGNKAYITIPPNVYATIYVSGNIDMGNGDINSDSSSSKVASHLTIYGLGTGTAPTFSTNGNGTEILSFYGPNYDISLKGTETTMGAMVGKSFSISGGGNGGFHYDEALSKGGAIAGWQVASYFDDSRVDPQ